MDREEIKQGLKANRCSFSIIANAIDKPLAQISAVASRKSTSREIAEAICKGLKKDIIDVFPDVSSYHTPVVANKEANLNYWREQLAS